MSTWMLGQSALISDEKKLALTDAGGYTLRPFCQSVKNSG